MTFTQPDSSYIGRHADLYDLFYAEKPYTDESAFVHQCIQEYYPTGRRILELACGTGTHSLLLERYGYQIIATDYSMDMLSRARAKAQEIGSRIEFRQQDMRTLDVQERPFDVVLCLFDSLGYVATNENIFHVLSSVRDHLVLNGLFLFEFWHAGAMLSSYEPIRIRRFKTSAGEIERISETHIDYKQQLCRVSYTINEMNSNGTYQTLQEMQINRFFLVQEMDFFLRQARLIPLKWFAGFRNDEEINDTVWHIVTVAQNA
jgi:SAM-dependent methyltransferase